ncbi:MAG: GNAT family N-acetyltransferase [Acidobacteriota bacterium]
MTAGKSEVLCPSDAGWEAAFSGVVHDVYHTAHYHQSPQLGRQGTPFLFVYREGSHSFLWPYLLTPIESAPAGYFDVTSVYGYAGPVTSVGATTDDAFIGRAWAALLDQWRQQGAVSAFTRFHPLIGNSHILPQLRDVSITAGDDLSRASGSTVSINLSLDPADQVRQYQKVLRQEIRKARELGFTTFRDEEWQHSDDFVRLYGDTMIRREGKSEYLIDAEWLQRFRTSLGSSASLFVTMYEGRVASALLAMEHADFLHAHLTGIDAELVKYSPLKIMLDDVRQWGTNQGLSAFHLGGGLGGAKDSLFQFKHRFSSCVHDFWIGCWILKRDEYRELESMRRKELEQQGINMAAGGFFPAYRYQVGVEAKHKDLGATLAHQ